MTPGSAVQIKVLVAEDQRLVRAGIVTMLGVTGEFLVVAEAENGRRALQEARRTRPDVALVDLRMPVMDGIEATRRIVSELPDTRVLALTTFGHDELLFAALGAGASGFLLKDVPAEQLLEAVTAVARGEGRIDPSVTATVVRHFRRHHQSQRSTQEPSALTAREDEVLRLLAKGMTNMEIAAELNVATGTVKTHVATILSKLGARDRLQAVIIAYESGRVTP